MSTGHAQVTPPTVTLPPGIDRLPSGALRVRVYGLDGKRRVVGTYPTVKDAKDALAVARSQILAGSYIERSKADTTLDGWFALWMPDRDVRALTLHKDWERYRLHIKPYLGHLPLRKITTYQVKRWLAALARDGRSVALRKKAHTLLSTSLGVHGAVGDERLTINPCTIVRAPLPERPDWQLLTRPDFERLYEAADGIWQPITLLAAFGGLRWSEIAGLQAKDYNRKTLHIERGLTYTPKQGVTVGPTKSGRDRHVPLTLRVREALDQHLREHPAVGEGWIFTVNGQPIPTHAQTREWKKIRSAAGVNCRFHDLRHSCVSWLIAGGASIADARDIAGHASTATTDLYTHTSDDRLASAVDRAFG